MTPKRQRLFDALKNLRLAPKEGAGELTVEVKATQYKEMCTRLRDDPAARARAAEAGSVLRERLSPDAVARVFEGVLARAAT